MPHVISCTTCSKQLRLPESLIGQLVCCPGCQTEFTVRDDNGRINILAAPEEGVPPPPSRDEEIPVVRAAPPRPAGVDQRPAAPAPATNGKGFQPFTFIVAVVWDPERRLRGELLARISPYGLQLRDREGREYHMPVGTRTRYMGGNRFMVDLGTRDLTLRIAKRNCQQTKLARHIAAYLNRQRPNMREADYLTAGAVRWLALVPLLVFPLIFLPRGGSGALGVFTILSITLVLGVLNWLLLRTLRLSLGARVGLNFVLWVVFGVAGIPLTYAVVRHLNSQVDPPRLAFMTRYGRSGQWSAMLPDQPKFESKSLRGTNLTFDVATVQLPWDRAKFEIWDASLSEAQFSLGNDHIFNMATQDVNWSDGSMRPSGTSNLDLQNKPSGREYTFQNSSGVKVKMQVYIVKPYVYILRVTWRGKMEQHNLDNFFSRFQPTPPNMGVNNPNDPNQQLLAPTRPFGLQNIWSPKDISNNKNDLLLYYDFEEIPQPNNDFLVFDQSGKGLNGTLTGGKRINGMRGNAILLDGQGSFIDFSKVGGWLNFEQNQPFTIACWVATKRDQGVILSMRNGLTKAPRLNVELLNDSRLAVKVSKDNNQWVDDLLARVGTAPVNDGVWHHIAVVRSNNNNGKLELFQDGFQVGQLDAWQGANFMGPITTDARTLGCDLFEINSDRNQGIFNNQKYLCCALDEFCIFNRALTPPEIQRLAGRAF
jgi:hypothetical protein